MTAAEEFVAMCKARYRDEEVARIVHDDAVKHGTVDMILDGQSVLPHPADAQRFHDRVKGIENLTATEKAQVSRIYALEAKIAELTESIGKLHNTAV